MWKGRCDIFCHTLESQEQEDLDIVIWSYFNILPSNTGCFIISVILLIANEMQSYKLHMIVISINWSVLGLNGGTDKLGMDIFPNLSQSFAIRYQIFFTDICGKYQDNNFQKKI